MSPSTNTHYRSIEYLTISTEAITISTLTSPHIKQTYFEATTKDLSDKLNKNNDKQDAEFKEIIAEKKSDKKIDKQLQTWGEVLKEASNKFSQHHEESNKTFYKEQE